MPKCLLLSWFWSLWCYLQNCLLRKRPGIVELKWDVQNRMRVSCLSKVWRMVLVYQYTPKFLPVYFHWDIWVRISSKFRLYMIYKLYQYYKKFRACLRLVWIILLTPYLNQLSPTERVYAMYNMIRNWTVSWKCFHYVIYIIYYIIGDQLGQKSSIFLLKNEWLNRLISLMKNWIRTNEYSEEMLRLIRTMCFEMKDQNQIIMIQNTLDVYLQATFYVRWAKIYGDPNQGNLNSKSAETKIDFFGHFGLLEPIGIDHTIEPSRAEINKNLCFQKLRGWNGASTRSSLSSIEGPVWWRKGYLMTILYFFTKSK